MVSIYLEGDTICKFKYFVLYLDLDMISSFRYYIKKEILYFDLTVVLYCLIQQIMIFSQFYSYVATFTAMVTR